MDSFIKPNKGLCAIEITTSGVALSFTPNSTKPTITICEFLTYPNNGDFSLDNLRTCLTTAVDQHGLKKTSCCWVLNPEHYRLTLLNTPNVPSSEYKNAVRWEIKDIVNYPLEDVTVDVFYPSNGEAPKKIYVVAAQLSFLQEIINVMEDCGLQPEAIDIREFAIRNLIAKLSKQNESTGFIDINDGNTLVIFVKDNKIQFVRRIPVVLQNIKENNDLLITELQRSFSYCQQELSQDIPDKFLLPPETTMDNDTIQNIAKALDKKITKISLEDIAEFQIQLNQELNSRCWATVGEALRNTI